MPNRGILGALGVFAVALAVFLVLDYNKPPVSTVPTPAPQASPIVGLGSAQVTQVVIHAKDKVLTLARAGNAWTYSLCPKDESPCAAQPADTTKTQAIVDTIIGLRPSRTVFGAPEGLPAYGLDSPSGGEIEIRGAGGRVFDLLIGAKSPDSTSYFVRLKNKNDIHAVPTAVIDTQLLGAVDAPPVPGPTPSTVVSPSPAASSS